MQKAVKFAECMRSNGVSEFPDPDASGQFTIDGIPNGSSLDPSSPAWQQAIGACKTWSHRGSWAHADFTQAAVGAPQVRPVHARQRCARLPGPHRNWAARRRIERFNEHSGVLTPRCRSAASGAAAGVQ
jgi:hypothetical protein